MKCTRLAFAAIVVLPVIAGCSKKEEGAAASSSASTAVTAAKVHACKQFELAGKCSEYTPKDDVEVGVEKGLCEESKGTWLAGSCPTEKQFARCVVSDHTLFFYTGVQSADAPFVTDEDFAKLDCEGVDGKLTLLAKAPPAPAGQKAPAAPAGKKAPPAAGSAKR